MHKTSRKKEHSLKNKDYFRVLPVPKHKTGDEKKNIHEEDTHAI